MILLQIGIRLDRFLSRGKYFQECKTGSLESFHL